MVFIFGDLPQDAPICPRKFSYHLGEPSQSYLILFRETPETDLSLTFDEEGKINRVCSLPYNDEGRAWNRGFAEWLWVMLRKLLKLATPIESGGPSESFGDALGVPSGVSDRFDCVMYKRMMLFNALEVSFLESVSL